MEFRVYGVSYKEADADVRDCAAFSNTQRMELYDQLLDVDVTQAVIPSTCNHSKLYFIYEKEEQLDQIKKLFLAAAGKTVSLLLKTGVIAVYYLFEVAVGYHSIVLDEDQILGQVRSCYQITSQCQTYGKQLHRMSQNCFAAAKQLRTAYKISEHPISTTYLATKSTRNATPLHNVSVLVTGNGGMAVSMLQYPQEEELSALYVCSYSRYKARRVMLATMGYIPFSKRYEVFPYCDVIYFMTTSPHRTLCREGMPPIDREQLYVSLAMPRGIDPQLA